MERDGVVRRAGQRPGPTRPSHVFELTPEVEQLLSSAYIPLLTHLIDTFADALPVEQVETMLRRAGRKLAEELLDGKRPADRLSSRVAMVSEMMNDQLGALTHVDDDDGLSIRGAGRPLAALTGKHLGVCLAIESMVAEVVGVPVRECCDRSERPKCCFEIQPRADRSRRDLADNRTGPADDDLPASRESPTAWNILPAVPVRYHRLPCRIRADP